MTLIFDSYYESISNGTIDLNNVDFGVILVTKEYTPDTTHLFSDIVPFVHKIFHFFVADFSALLSPK